MDRSVSTPYMKSKNADNFSFVRGLAMVLAATTLAAAPAHAGFDVSVSPPRLELHAKPGDTVRQTISINNLGNDPGRYLTKTADWELGAAGEAVMQEGAPKKGSCRPWVKLERHEIGVAPGDTRDYRFEVQVPENARNGECRFALLVSSDAGTVTPSGGNFISIPIVGRLAVIVYVTIGDAKPDMKLEHITMQKVNRKLLPVASFRNSGDAHGRVSGHLEALDANNHKVDLVADESVILPNSARDITLTPMDWSSGEGKTPTFDLAPPMHVRGTLQFLGGGEVKIDQVLR
jgi:fimbrial chaperone protein